MKRIVSIILVIVLVFTFIVSASAIDYNMNIDMEAEAVLLTNLETNIEIYSKNPEKVVYPASLTKILTYVVVCDNCSDIENETVTITEDLFVDLDPESSVMGLSEHIGETFTVKDLLYGLMVGSGNDSAVALAVHISGSISKFAELMNKKAEELGCTKSHFVNPHGLHDMNHYTTAKDMTIITKKALECDSFKDIVSTVSYTPNGFTDEIKTTNFLMDKNADDGKYYYPYVTGIKTGYTDEAGKCLVALAEKEGYSYLLVQFNTPFSQEENINYAMLDAKDVFEYCFNDIYYQDVMENPKAEKSVEVKFSKDKDRTTLVPGGVLNILLEENYDKNKITFKFDCPEEIEAPINIGDTFGKVTAFYGDEELGSVDLISAEKIEVNFLLKLFSNTYFIIALIVIVIVILVIIIVVSKKRKKRRREIERRNRGRRYK